MAANGQKELAIVVTAQDKASSILQKVQSAVSNVAASAKKTADSFGLTSIAGTAMGTALGFSVVGAVNMVKTQMLDAAKQALAFETAMARINTVARVSPAQLNDLADSIEDITTRLPIGAAELADAGYQIASAGVEFQNIAPMLELSGQIAVGAMTDTTTAFNGVIAVIKGYGMNMTEATAVADMFFKANELGQTTVGEIAVAIQGVATKAHAAGMSIQELMAFYATFTGVTGKATNVTTQLEGAIAAIASPTQAARAKMDELGISYGKAAIEEKGFATVAKEVYDAVDGDTVALRELIPEKEALTLITALATTQYDKFRQSVDDVSNSVGSLKNAVEIMNATTETKLLLMQNKVDTWKRNVGKALLFVASMAIDFGYAMIGSVQVTVAGFMYAQAGIQAALSAAAKIMGKFITNFGEMASDVYQIAKNIAANIKAAFTGGDFVGLTSGTTAFKDALEEVAIEMSGPFQAAQDTFTAGINNLQGLNANTAESLEFMEQSFGGAADGAEGAGEAFGGFGDEAGSAADQAKKLEEAVEKLGDAYDKVEETATKALENVKKKTEETLGELDKKITDIYSKMEEATASFMSENTKSNEDLAGAYVDQEEKVASLLDSIKEKQQSIKDLQDEMASQQSQGQDTSGTQSQIESDQADLADIEAQYDAELEALQAFADQATELQAQIDEARRRAALTDFERTVEDIQIEKDERQKAFDEKMLQLTNELLAIQDQKAKILALEQETTAAINALRQNAANIYEGVLGDMTAATAEQVQAMIDLLNSLEEVAGSTGGADLNTSISDIVGAGSTTNNVTVNVDVSGANAELSPQELAAYIVSEITRQLELQSLSSSTT